MIIHDRLFVQDYDVRFEVNRSDQNGQDVLGSSRSVTCNDQMFFRDPVTWRKCAFGPGGVGSCWLGAAVLVVDNPASAPGSFPSLGQADRALDSLLMTGQNCCEATYYNAWGNTSMMCFMKLTKLK